MENKVFKIETPFGDKEIEVVCGELRELSLKTDLLVCSAFRYDYLPLRASLIGSLQYDFGISVNALSKKPALDVRALGVWISKPLPESCFGRIACVEMSDYARPISDAAMTQELFDTLFFVVRKAEQQQFHIASIAMPLLGTGYQQMRPEKVVLPLLTESINALNQNAELRRIVFFERDFGKFQALCSAMDEKIACVLRKIAFISYSHKDMAAANYVAGVLEEMGIKVWIDHKKIRDPDFAQDIVDAIAKASVFVLLVSNHSLQSNDVYRELCNAVYYTDQSHLSISLLRLEAVDYPSRFGYYLRGLDYTDASSPPVESKIDSFCAKIQKKLTDSHAV